MVFVLPPLIIVKILVFSFEIFAHINARRRRGEGVRERRRPAFDRKGRRARRVNARYVARAVLSGSGERARRFFATASVYPLTLRYREVAGPANNPPPLTIIN